MRRLTTLAVVVAVVVVSALLLPASASGEYSFGDWASDHGYSPGDVMPNRVLAVAPIPPIDSLIGIGDFDWKTTPTRSLQLSGNDIWSIEPDDFSELPSLTYFDVRGNVNMIGVSRRNTVVNQTSLATLLGGGTGASGIGELDGIIELNLSGVDFANITDLEPLDAMDDLIDLWLVDTLNLNASGLDLLLDNLATIEGTDIEGMVHMTQADFAAFNTAGGELLATWDAEPGHHVEYLLSGDMNHDTQTNGLDVDPFVAVLLASQFDVAADINGDGTVNGLDVDPFVAAVVGGGTQQIPEPPTLLLVIVALGMFGGWRKRGVRR